MINWNCFIAALILCIVGSCAYAQETATIDTNYGPVIGYYYFDTAIFRGIPFASPPVFNNRFSSPIPPKPWKDPIHAFINSYACPQEKVDGLYYGDEDCLYLDVYSPSLKSNAALPVMVWLYGGGFQFGDGYEFGLYDGTNLATATNMVVVSANYRVGALGFLALDELKSSDPSNSTGNFGVLDQRMAMQWVKDNIKQFGGDPNHIMIAGESAGAISVCLHLASPGSFGLYNSAIIESGTCDSTTFFTSLNESVAWGETYSGLVGCSNESSRVECLRKLDASVFVGTPSSKFTAGEITWQTIPSSNIYPPMKGIESDVINNNITISIFDIPSLPNTIETVRALHRGAINVRVPNFKPRVRSLSVQDNKGYYPVLYPAFSWSPTIDGTVLTDIPLHLIQSGKWAQVPVIAGSNKDEGSIFLDSFYDVLPQLHNPLNASDVSVILEFLWPQNSTITSLVMVQYPFASYPTVDDLVERIFRDFMFACSTRRALQAMAKYKVETFLYEFDYIGDWIEDPYLGVYHSAELEFVWANPWPPVIHWFSTNDTIVSQTFGTFWRNMAASGSPSSKWQTYRNPGDQHMQIEVISSMSNEVLLSQCSLWDDIYYNNP